MMSRVDSRDEYERLCRMISRWNDRRVELFEISMPNKRLEFEGVMKFYFQYQDVQGQKVATKCIRVSNTATVQDVIEVLVQKFRPDLRMLPNLTSYALYEVHNNEEERRMESHEKPLLTMLKWSSKDIDGRFLLRNEHKMPYSFHSKLIQGKKSPQTKKKKSPKIEKRKNRYMTRTPTDITDGSDIDSEKGRIARSLYSDYPPSRFTRSITNPDIVRTHWNNTGNRRSKGPIPEQLLDGSTIPISMETLAPDIPSKSILATKSDTALQLVRSAVDKFGLTYDPEDYCLVQVTIPSVEGSTGDVNAQERILDDNESPVKIHKDHTVASSDSRQLSTIQFHLRRRDSLKEHFKFPSIDLSSFHEPVVPVLIEEYDELTSTDHPRRYSLSLISTEIGSRSSSLNPENRLCLTNHGIRPRHCLVSKSNDSSNTYTITLLDPTALVKVNNILVTDARPLPDDAIVQLGDSQKFRFVIPASLHIRSNSALPAHPTFHHIPHDGLSKAFSSDDLGHSIHFKGQLLDTHMKYRAVSEHTLKGEGSVMEDNDSEINAPPDDSMTSTKKRHSSTPQQPLIDGTPVNELAVLPASITFQQSNEMHLLQTLVNGINGYLLQFKLAPSYAIYMIARHHLSSNFFPDPNRHESLVFMLKYTCSLIKKTVKENKNVAGVLAFWLSNTSELLHFLRRDYLLYMFAQEYENTLTSVIHMAYKHFTEYMVREISVYLPVFLSESSDVDIEGPINSEPSAEPSQEPDVVAAVSSNNLVNVYWSRPDSKGNRKSRATIGDILSTLSATVSLLHLCKVNSTLSILIFNLLFRYISMRLFNKLITEPQYCTKAIGLKLQARLEKLKNWADKENLKLPADEHLTTIFEAARLLVTSNEDIQDIEHFHSLVIHLNSLQIKTLLHNSQSVNGKEFMSHDFAEKLIAMAYEDVDQKLLADCQEVRCQEDSYLELPFLIPEHGYSCDSMRGVPVGLEEYLETAINSGLCDLVVAKDSLGCWIPPRLTTSKQRESPLSTQTSTQMSQTLPKNFPYDSSNVTEDKSHRPKSSMDVQTESLYDLENINIITVTLNKGPNKSLGISICEARDPREDGNSVGIFIKSLSRDGPAYLDGRLHPGDQILQIDNTSLNGYTRELVTKFLRSFPNQVTITVATNVAQIFQINEVFQTSPRLPNKLSSNSNEAAIPPPKEGSSHAMKAARRELRRQQQGPSRTYDQYQSHTMSPVPTLMSKWIQEQREINQQKTPHRISTPVVSMSSLIPEREEPSLPSSTVPIDLMSDSSFYRVATPSGSDISDNQRRGPSYNKPKPTSTHTDFTNFGEKYPVESGSSNFSLGNNSQAPYKDVSSLSGHPSDADTSQSYPSLAREKLSMEVGYHTQLSSTGLSVSSVLEQLSRKGKKGELQVSELQGFEVDEVQLEKQRMQLLFYRQQKEKKEQQMTSTLIEQSPFSTDGKWSKADQSKSLDEDDDELLMDPEQMLLLMKLKQELDYVRKLINDQRKRCRELQFAKEREEQSLAQAENRLKSQHRHFMPFMRPEDEVRRQREQKRKFKEWERLYSEKKEELHQNEVKEMQAKARLRALEQHASDLKKRLHVYETKQATCDIPEREHNWSRPLRVMSTDSITTGSSWLSNENIAKDTVSIGGGSEYNSMDYQVSGGTRSPVGCHSDSSSPGPFSTRWPPPSRGTDESTEIPVLMHNPDIAHNKRMELCPSEQEERLRILKDEHNHHLSSLENIPARSAKDKAIQLHQLKREVRSLHDEHDTSSEGYSKQHYYSVRGTDSFDSRESSLSSSTPDVVPLMFTIPQKPLFNQSESNSSALQRPTTSCTVDSVPSDTFKQSLLRSRSRDEISDLRRQVKSLDYTGHRYQLPVVDQEQRRKMPKAGGPHSYSRGRPDPTGNEDRGRFYKERLPGNSKTSTIGSGYVQRQQTEL